MNAVLGADREADGGLAARGEQAGGIGTRIGGTLVGRRSTRVAVATRSRRARSGRARSGRARSRRLARRGGADGTVLVERGRSGVFLVLDGARFGEEGEALGGGLGRVGQLVVVEDDARREHAAE